jgi:CubicO group peptidase (beta-lactamase class C family)
MRMRSLVSCVVLPVFGVACAASPSAPPAPPGQAAAPVAAGRQVGAATPREAAAGAVAPRFAKSAPPPPAFADPDRAKKVAELVPKLEKHVDEFFAKEKPPSLAVAMVVDGKVVMTRVLGVRDKATNAPATERTMYRIGSISKTFTATLVMSLRDEGRLRLDEPAEKYLPELARVEYPFRDAPRITLRHLLSHSSGLPRLGDFDYTRPDHDVTEAELLGALDRAKLESAPGVHYEYSNFGMALVGAIVARQAPEGSLRAALAKRITGPLGMTHTTFDPSSVKDAEVATGYAKKGDTKPAPPWRLGASEAAGGLWSTAPDMARWIALQLAAWPPRDEPETGPVARATLREAHVPGFALGMNARVEGEHLHARSDAIGLGWHSRETCAYERMVEHGGAIDGFHSDAAFAPERGFGLVVLASSIDTPTASLRDRIFEEAARVLSAREQRPAPETTAIVSKLAATIATCDEKSWSEMFGKAFRSAVPFPQFEGLCKRLGKAHGQCRLDKTLSIESPRSGKFALACDRGGVVATADVKDEDGAPRFSGLFVRSTGLAPAKDTLRAANDILALYTRWDAAKFKALFAKADAEAAVKSGFEKQRAAAGSCRLAKDAEKDGGDGERGAVLRLACDRGAPQELAIGVDENGKVEAVFFRPRAEAPAGPEPRCVDPPPATAPRR